jgi:hypothetical protein
LFSVFGMTVLPVRQSRLRFVTESVKKLSRFFLEGAGDVVFELGYVVGHIIEVAGFAKAVHPFGGIGQLKVDFGGAFTELLFGAAKQLTAVVLFLVEGVLELFVIEVEYLFEQEYGAFQGLKLAVQHFHGGREVHIKVEVGKIGLNEAVKYFGHIVHVLFLFPLEGAEVIEAVVGDGADEVCLYILDRFLLHAQPFDEGLLHDVLSVFLAAHQVISNGVQQGLIKRYGLSLIHVYKVFARYGYFLQNPSVTDAGIESFLATTIHLFVRRDIVKE